MPELPDLNVFSQNLDKQLAGKKLEAIVVARSAPANASAAAFKKAVGGNTLTKIYREGKELRFLFKNKQVIGIHLMLRGKLVWFEDENVPKHSLVQFRFAGGKQLAMTDYQAQARIQLNPEQSKIPDAMSAAVTPTFWKEQLQSRATIKNLLLDQHVVRGIGNAYADEILWDAGVSPFSISNKIPPAKIKALASSVKKVLKNAEKQIRKQDPGIIGGELRDFLLIHNSKKKNSPGGFPIKQKINGARKTYYTEEQELYK
jgi:formamidopyrimidine-DNA glycosylase